MSGSRRPSGTSSRSWYVTPASWSAKQLLTEVWGPAYTNQFHYLRQYLGRLRRKLEPDPSRPRHLLTEPGMGYRFQP